MEMSEFFNYTRQKLTNKSDIDNFLRMEQYILGKMDITKWLIEQYNEYINRQNAKQEK